MFGAQGARLDDFGGGYSLCPGAAAIPTQTQTPTPTSTPTVTPTPTPGGATTLTDDLNDTTKILALSNASYFYLETGSPSITDGDTSRLTRYVTTTQWATWQLNGVRSMTATAYFWPSEAVNHFAFAYSNDNVSFTAVAPTINDAGGNWNKFAYGVSVPAGANYVRIIFPVSGNYWTPQLGQVVLSTNALVALGGRKVLAKLHSVWHARLHLRAIWHYGQQLHGYHVLPVWRAAHWAA